MSEKWREEPWMLLFSNHFSARSVMLIDVKNIKLYIMEKRKNKNGVPMWVSIGAVILIILLIVWLTYAMFAGDTDVSAPAPEVLNDEMANAIVSLIGF